MLGILWEDVMKKKKSKDWNEEQHKLKVLSKIWLKFDAKNKQGLKMAQ